MKRIIALLLLVLVLCGCAAPRQEGTTAPEQTTQPPTSPTEPAGLYEPVSDLEIQTGGTVRCFRTEEDCCGFRMMGGDVLLFSGGENTVLTRYAGNQLYAIASTELDCRVSPADTSFQISGNGITYFHPQSRELVFLDNDLKEVSRLALPGDMVGKPVLSANRTLLFYCTADAVRIYDTATGLDRLLKSISYARQSVEDILLEDTVLRCSLTDEHGTEYSIFLSTQTGELLGQTLSGLEVTSRGSWFYAKTREGIQELLVFGQPDGEPAVLTPVDPFAHSWYLEELHGVVTATVEADRTILDCYDLSTGLRTATVELPQGIVPRDVEYRGSTGEILVCAVDPAGEASVLLAWDKDADPAADTAVYTGPRYTADAPDAAGLEACAALARQIGEKHGVQVLIAGDAVACQPWDYTLELEYQVSVIRAQLEALDRTLSKFPEGFFGSLPRAVNICIVRTIRGSAESGSLEQAQGIQFWEGELPYVVLAAGDTLEGAFYHEIFHVLDSRILSNTRIYYQWDDLNPDGAEYFGDYTTYRTADVSQYLQEEDRAFIDAYSMCFAREDRARIMEYACQEGNAHYFQSQTMQAKLKTLCQGIREVFGLEDYREPLLWEQYLTEALVTE